MGNCIILHYMSVSGVSQVCLNGSFLPQCSISLWFLTTWFTCIFLSLKWEWFFLFHKLILKLNCVCKPPVTLLGIQYLINVIFLFFLSPFSTFSHSPQFSERELCKISYGLWWNHFNSLFFAKLQGRSRESIM